MKASETNNRAQSDEVDPAFQLFVIKGFVSVPSFSCGALELVKRLLKLTFCRSLRRCFSHVLAQGIEMGLVKMPLHKICVNTNLVSGGVRVGVCEQLPIPGVSMILGNDLARTSRALARARAFALFR